MPVAHRNNARVVQLCQRSCGTGSIIVRLAVWRPSATTHRHWRF